MINQTIRNYLLFSIRTSILLLLFFITTESKGQVRILTSSSPYLCSTTNGVLNKYQTAVIKIHGPENANWYFSYSLNNAPAITANNGKAITSNEYELEINFRNESRKVETYTLVLKRAWNQGKQSISISPEFNNLSFQVLSLPQPEIMDYSSKARNNSSINYQAAIGKSSDYEIIVPQNAQLTSFKTSVKQNKKIIDFTIKWPPLLGSTYFKFIETNVLSCSSDTLFAGIKLTDHFSIKAPAPVYLCEGQSVLLSPQPDLPGNYSYQWDNGSTSSSFLAKQPGIYQVSITDDKTGQSESCTLKVIPASIPDFTIPPLLILEEGQSICIKVPDKFCNCAWSTGEKCKTKTIDSPGAYSVTVITDKGCTLTKNFKAISSKDAFTLSLPSLTHLCSGDLIELSPSLSIEQPYRYKWNTGSTQKSIEINSPGEYWLEVEDENGLIRTARTTVIQHPLPIVDLGPDFMLWDAETRILDAKNPGAHHLWNTGQHSQRIEVDSGGPFSVLVTDQYGCFAADEIEVNYRLGHRFSVDLGDDILLCSGDSILLSAIIDGHPTPPLSYNWYPVNSHAEEIYVKKTGEYCLQVKDGNGNKEKSCVNLKVLPIPPVDLGPDRNLIKGEKLELDAGNPDCFYEWSTGSIDQRIKVNKSGEYNVKVSNTYNCSSEDTISIKFQDKLPEVEIPLAFSPNGDGKNDQLFIKGANIKSIHFLIYNRLGQKLFESKNPDKGWNGYYKGELQNIDVYVYLLDITYTNGKSIRRKGNISLLR